MKKGIEGLARADAEIGKHTLRALTNQGGISEKSLRLRIEK